MPRKIRSIQKGDWVRFYKGGSFVIGVVEYRKERQLGKYGTLCTNKGAIDEDEILEVRRNTQEGVDEVKNV